MVELCGGYTLKLVPCGCLCQGVGREGSLCGECSHVVCGESLNPSELEASEKTLCAFPVPQAAWKFYKTKHLGSLQILIFQNPAAGKWR